MINKLFFIFWHDNKFANFCFVATLRIAGTLEKSTEVMRGMQSLIKVPEIQQTMQEMSKEMMKVSYHCCGCFVMLYFHLFGSIFIDDTKSYSPFLE